MFLGDFIGAAHLPLFFKGKIMTSRTYLLAFILIVVAVAFGISFLVRADDINDPNGIVRIGDDLIYFTDDDLDGRFEKNWAKVGDDVNATAELNGTAIMPGHLVNIWVFPNGKSRISTPYFIRNVKRGRALNQYVPLSTANH